MNNTSISDALDHAITKMVSEQSPANSSYDADLTEFLEIARELQCLPRPEFKTQLKVELEWKASGRAIAPPQPRTPEPSRAVDFCSLLGASSDLYPFRRGNIAASAALHGCVLALICLVAISARRAPKILGITIDKPKFQRTEYAPPKGAGGGSNGGGGANKRLNASKGVAPPPSKIQFTPPIIQLPDQEPKLAIRASVIAPPDLNVQEGQMGDPLSRLLIPSGGPGINGGIGLGDRGGIGAAHGPRAGSGGFGSGSGVTMPRAIYDPEPEYSDEARLQHYQGVVSLLVVVGPDGRAHQVQVLRALGMGLDEKAIEAVRTWRFEPGTKDGRPVPVLMEVEVDFRIH